MPETDNIIFQRHIAFDNYLEESLRFTKYYTPKCNFSANDLVQIEAGLNEICRRVAGHPRVPVYRDYMPWNIMLDAEQSMHLLDFQDMLIGSYAYDLVSLLHDRDLDWTLGDAVIGDCIKNFIELRELSDKFKEHYLEALLQRHFRLSGQFLFLTEKHNNPVYANWVPGCLKRAGRAAGALTEFHEFGTLLAREIPDFATGFNNPYVY